MPISSFNSFSSREELAAQLAQDVGAALQANHELGEFSSIALSGGSTPKLFLTELGKLLGDAKEMIYFALVDERFVAPNSERSNERMIREMLGIQDHPSSEFLSLYMENSTPEDVAKRAHARLLDDDELPFDVVTLGMGLDGHTASFFPKGDQLAQAVNSNTSKLFEVINAPGADEPRLTMTLPCLVSAKKLILHFEGEEKRKVYEQALEDGPADDLPIRHVLRHPDANIDVYCSL